MIRWGLPLFILETAIFFIEDGIKVLVACLIGLGTNIHIVVRKYSHSLQLNNSFQQLKYVSSEKNQFKILFGQSVTTPQQRVKCQVPSLLKQPCAGPSTSF